MPFHPRALAVSAASSLVLLWLSGCSDGPGAWTLSAGGLAVTGDDGGVTSSAASGGERGGGVGIGTPIGAGRNPSGSSNSSTSTSSSSGSASSPAPGSGSGGGPSSPADGDDGGALDIPPAPSRGAPVPYWEYEAEDPTAATTTGTVLPASTTFGDIAAEASGRSAVRLQGAGQRVSFTLSHWASSIVVRYSIPDAPAGGGATATLGLYVNGLRQDLALTSRYSWTYGDADAQGMGSENPAAGTAHHFFDEAHAMFSRVAPGSVVTLQQDAQDGAAWYVVDLVDFEDVGQPLAQPAGSLSITDYGATPDDGTDDSTAINTAIAAASAQGKVLWIPQGTFDTKPNPGGLTAGTTPKLRASGVTIRGAGMWYSVIEGFGAQFVVSGNDNRFFDFALFGDVTYRDDTEGWQGFDGPAGTGSRMENVWIEHETAGWWVGKGAFAGSVVQPLTNGLVIHGVRVRDTYADGVNLNEATANSTVEQSSFRNTGDDSLATWSYAADGPTPCTGNVFQQNTVQTVWRANCIALYGGTSTSVLSNACADTSNYSGIFIATTGGFDVIPFAGTTVVQHNTLTRAGGWHAQYDYNGMGALKFFADGQPIAATIRVSDLLIEDAVLGGVQFSGNQAVSGVTIDSVQVTGYTTSGILVDSGANGSAQLTNVVVSGGPAPGLTNDAATTFTLGRGAGDTGW